MLGEDFDCSCCELEADKIADSYEKLPNIISRQKIFIEHKLYTTPNYFKGVNSDDRGKILKTLPLEE